MGSKRRSKKGVDDADFGDFALNLDDENRRLTLKNRELENQLRVTAKEADRLQEELQGAEPEKKHPQANMELCEEIQGLDIQKHTIASRRLVFFTEENRRLQEDLQAATIQNNNCQPSKELRDENQQLDLQKRRVDWHS